MKQTLISKTKKWPFSNQFLFYNLFVHLRSSRVPKTCQTLPNRPIKPQHRDMRKSCAIMLTRCIRSLCLTSTCSVSIVTLLAMIRAAVKALSISTQKSETWKSLPRHSRFRGRLLKQAINYSLNLVLK